MLRKILFALCLALPLAGCEAGIFANTLTSCAMQPEPELLPESLPVAVAGEPYSVQLEVINTSAPVHGIYVSDTNALPEGLWVEHQDRDSHGLITGTPVKAGTYEVHVSAGTYGTQCAGLRASRVYRLEVME
ncbi:MAG: putative Ig domain-containing protein [Pseudomonas sp.]|uniref:putative Ig domain-containing protein n=1 Tax=Pseudomonas sp. TaxID=306 RepID=UPI00299E4D22|nr:putative Ig domain-containing protein [Pseudomonas sp.]MDX1725645.1 putative Ig domain-containing protein [Pseudomonas sp.]